MPLETDKKKIIFPTKKEREELVDNLQKNMKSDEEYSVIDFDKHFNKRRAELPMRTYGVMSINEYVNRVVNYDHNDQFDVRPLIFTVTNKKDRDLIRDVCVHVAERFVNVEPDSNLTLKQFCTILTSRLIAVGF